MSDLQAAARYLSNDEKTLLEIWYDDYHRTTFGIGAKEATGMLPDLRPFFEKWCDKVDLHNLLCLEWNYCEAKQRISQPAQLVAALADFLCASLLQLSTEGSFALSALVIEYGFDKICDCNDS